MSQFIFGAGVLFGTPLTDASGTAIATNVATPVQFGTLQDVSIDISFDTKMLHGPLQFPEAIGRGKGKISGKAKAARINGTLINSLFFGQTLTSAIQSDFIDTTGRIIPATPFTITVGLAATSGTTMQIPGAPTGGVWTVDLGVKDANGNPMTRVAAAPIAGQYSVAAGAYLFASADAGLTVQISYQYTATGGTAALQTVTNVLMGQAPTFQAEFYTTYQGKSMSLTLFNCLASKLSFATKLDDFTIPSFDFDAFANPAGQVMKWAVTER